MFKLAVFFGLVAAALAAPLDDSTTPVAIISSSQDGPNPDGSYSWSYEAANGIRADERGELADAPDSESGKAMHVTGSYTYLGEDGVEYKIVYVANENGFQPQGSHLPTPPPIPEEIQKALQYIADHPEENNIDAPKQ